MTHHLPVSTDSSHDPLTRMRVFELATELGPDCVVDAPALHANPVTKEVASQLYAALDLYRRTSAKAIPAAQGKDRARIFEFALGSVRESMSWYKTSEPVLGVSVVKKRRDRLEEMRRLLLAIIPRERGRPMK